MNAKSIRKKLKKYKLGEIEIAVVDCIDGMDTGTAVVFLPYETISTKIEFTGPTAKEAAESLIENICCELDDMIDHLEECKSDLQQGAEKA